jgi:superfamily II DNA or RNA helicase
MVRNTRAHLDVKLPRRVAATHLVSPGNAEADVLACLARVIRERYRDASGADRWRLMTLQMQAGSSPTALRHGLRHHVEGASANGFAPVLDALDRVAVSAKTTALIDLARRSREKKIVFTRFRATLDELARALNAAGFRVAIFHGGLTAAEKASAIADFEANAEILLSSEIGGEGRNLQFCRTVVNYDLPWNPTTIEQRVGRVHRIGQTREVFVFNFCLAGSVEERVLAILHDKINLFELVAGEMEMILGHLDAEHDFATLVMDAWARSQSTESEEQAFAELSDAITSARTRYQQTSEIDRTLFSEDYEV